MANAHIVGGSYQVGGFIWSQGDSLSVGQVRGISGTSLNGKVASVQLVSEAQKKSLIKATATGLAGAAIAGPVGALAGVVAGGNSQETTFICRLYSGGEFIARGDSRIFELLLSESMKPQRVPVSGSSTPQPVVRTPGGIFKMIAVSFLVAIGLIFLLLIS
jgi:hypothetical protein